MTYTDVCLRNKSIWSLLYNKCGLLLAVRTRSKLEASQKFCFLKLNVPVPKTKYKSRRTAQIYKPGQLIGVSVNVAFG